MQALYHNVSLYSLAAALSILSHRNGREIPDAARSYVMALKECVEAGSHLVLEAGVSRQKMFAAG